MHSHLFSILPLATDSYEKSSSEAFCLSEKFGKTVTLVKKSPLDELKVSKAKKFILKGSLMINWNLRTVGGWLSPTEKKLLLGRYGYFYLFCLGVQAEFCDYRFLIGGFSMQSGVWMLVIGCGCHIVPFFSSSLTAFAQWGLAGNWIQMAIMSG